MVKPILHTELPVILLIGRGVKLLVLHLSCGFTTVMGVEEGMVVMVTITHTGQTELPTFINIFLDSLDSNTPHRMTTTPRPPSIGGRGVPTLVTAIISGLLYQMVVPTTTMP